jgi:hypothetical protein
MNGRGGLVYISHTHYFVLSLLPLHIQEHRCSCLAVVKPVWVSCLVLRLW